MRFFGLCALLLSAFCSIGPVRADSTPSSFAYVLQADAFTKSKAATVAKLASCGRDWIVLDAVFSEDSLWQRAELDSIRKGKEGRKIVAYISIGEAEDYRPYWHTEWGQHGHLTTAAPSWLGLENPDWTGNYRVKYWNPEWQKLMLAAINDAMTCGFDGVYLDIVDGFETFEQTDKEYIDNRVNPETKQTFRRDMVDWVKAIAAQARRSNPEAIVIPQNGSQLLAQPDFLATINAIGIEDLFTNGNQLQPKSHTNEVLEDVRRMIAVQKPVLLIEYPKRAQLQSRSKELAKANGMVWLITDRELKTLGVSGR